MEQSFYYDYGTWLQQQLCVKTQKISVDAGFTCPNRDGRIGHTGCLFCNNNAFTPKYCNSNLSVEQQIAIGKKFYAKKYTKMKYLVYFQSYTNTYQDVQQIKELYDEALAQPDVIGIVVGTRPDCMNDDILNYLERLNKQTFVMVEFGVESIYDDTLQRIHRGHNFACSQDAIHRTASRNIPIGVHLILGLPGENEERLLHTADVISQLPVDVLKLHQLQILKNTPLAAIYQKEPFHVYNLQEYISLVAKFITRLDKRIALDRFVSSSPPNLLIAPQWGVKVDSFQKMLLQEMSLKNYCQGCMRE